MCVCAVGKQLFPSIKYVDEQMQAKYERFDKKLNFVIYTVDIRIRNPPW